MHVIVRALRVGFKSLELETMSYYAVAKGRRTGIFSTWAECEIQVKGFNGAKYKKFGTRSDAESFITSAGGTIPDRPKQMKLIEFKEAEEYWPSDEDLDDNDLLLAAATNLENSMNLASSKRKAESSSSTDNKKLKHESKIWEPEGMKKFGDHMFLIDCEGFVIVYTDGSCENNGQKYASAGLGVYFGEDHPLNTAKPVSGRATNNCGEIQAASLAIKLAKQQNIKKLCISTDSQFLINSITQWVRGWKRNGWKLKNGSAVKNTVDFQELDQLLTDKNIEIKWNYVKGHKGIKGNEMADNLAKEGAQMYKKIHGANE